jgi:hypothetical protein
MKLWIDPIPDEFDTYREAAEFWDTHDTIDYPEVFETVEVKAEFRGRVYEVKLDKEINNDSHPDRNEPGYYVW